MILRSGVRRSFRLAPFGAALLLGGCDLGVLDPKGPIGDANLQILVDSVAIMLERVHASTASPGGYVIWYKRNDQINWVNGGAQEAGARGAAGEKTKLEVHGCLFLE
jgi:hypothetical protein